MKKIISIMLLMIVCSVSYSKGGSFGGGRSSGFGSKSFSTSRSSVSSSSNSFGKSSTASSVSGSTSSKLFTKFKESNSTSAPSSKIIASDLKKIFNRDYRQQRRTNFYSGYSIPHYVQPVYMNHQSYGNFDALLMWSILDNMGDRHMYYHHQDDPSFQQWRSDANALCNQGNKEICDKLQDLDKDVSTLKSLGVKKDSTYMTDGVDPNIYISQGIEVSDLSEIKICTGTQSSDYTRFSTQIAESTKLKVQTISTNGSIDNLYKLSEGKCDMAFAQSDTIVSSELITIFELKTEENAILICNNQSNVKTLSDLNEHHSIYVGSDQTGSLYTFNSLSTNNVANLSKPKLINDKPIIAASLLVNDEKNSCMFAVDTWDAPYIMQLDKMNNTKIIPIDYKIDKYGTTRLDRLWYKNLIQSRFNGWWDSGTTTLSVNPKLVTTSLWAQKNPIILYDVLMLNKQFLIKELK
jgi:TRAP-type uncharacterized transport system substrate-binding protein